MAMAPHSLPALRSSFLAYSAHPKLTNLTPSFKYFNTRRVRQGNCTRIAAELDQNTAVAIAVGIGSVAVGIGIPIFYETQIDSAAKRDNTQACFPCSGTGAQACRFCTGKGTVTVVLGGGENEVSQCVNCDGAGSLTCTTCQGSGIQPRYLDRREFKDDD
ncbi:protein disulfide-isomerase LQY1-like protein [Carex littledalei]|uniref:Protein disulfide-isomerase LQY1-like protein n=1 Tax=Carex littledalei TaxID=544730 RepID=A0A833QT50_9POAL|nr:protein disulfide-isomerase LQY1-like protein [Carex littledalei]